VYIFIDTNVFYNNWFLKTANFEFLFHFINNTGSRLLISTIVCDEVNNINKRELLEIIDNIKTQLKKAAKLNNMNDNFDANLLQHDYSFKNILLARTTNVDFIDYNTIPHADVVHRALNRVRPFQEGEKGYRDTLIWLSLLKYLKDNGITGEVAFISNNKSDFFTAIGGCLTFHQHLQKDIQDSELLSEIKTYDSLFRFVDNVIDKDTHGFNHYDYYDKYNNDFDPFLEEEAVMFLEEMPKSEIKHLLSHTNYGQLPVANYLKLKVNLFEGVEDPEILHCKKMDNNTVFVSYRYNLRIVDFDFEILSCDYYANKEIADSVYYNIDIEDETVKLSCFVRVYLEVTFTHNIQEESQGNFSVSNIYFK